MKKIILFFIIFLIVNLPVVFSIEEGVYFYHNDRLGSPRVITDSNGEIVWSSDYEDFGKPVNEEGDETYKYTGKELDQETGLYYYGARYYDPETGRFVTADKIETFPNPYVYARNNPLKYVDPSGNQMERIASSVVTETYLQGLEDWMPEGFKRGKNIAWVHEKYGISPEELVGLKRQAETLPEGVQKQIRKLVKTGNIDIAKARLEQEMSIMLDIELTKQRRMFKEWSEWKGPNDGPRPPKPDIEVQLKGSGELFIPETEKLRLANNLFGSRSNMALKRLGGLAKGGVRNLGVVGDVADVYQAYNNPVAYLEGVNERLSRKGLYGFATRALMLFEAGTIAAAQERIRQQQYIQSISS